MKKQLICLLTICLLLTCFTACGQQKVTVTQTNTPPVTEDVVSAEQQVSSVESKPEQANKTESSSKVSTNDNKPQATVSTSPVASAGSSQNTVVNQAQEKDPTTENLENGDTNCAIPDYPTFTSLKDLKDWFQSGTQWAEDRANVMRQYTTDAITTYYRPSIPENHPLFTLDYVEIHTPTGQIAYYYSFVDKSIDESLSGVGLSVAVLPTSYDPYTTNYYKFLDCVNRSEEGYSLVQADGIPFICRYNKEFNSTRIYWMQNEVVHAAVIYGYHDQLDQIIPLLELEQVTVKLNNDQVVQ